ncbi:hypothetical protein ACFQ0D_25785 [Micromonospora zhanjiangensis]
MSLPSTAKIPFGGDYNPEQWPDRLWDDDYRLVGRGVAVLREER